MSVPHPEDRRQLLKADCSQCFGLCCVALSFARSADFALSKPAGEPCVKLQDDFSCGIHEQLRTTGFKGCTVFECFGAGQKVAQGSYGGRSWAEDPSSRVEMFAVFPVMRDLHELLWYLSDASTRTVAPALARAVKRLIAATSAITDLAPAQLLEVDVQAHHASVAQVLARVSEDVRSQTTRPCSTTGRTREVGPRADVMGRDFAGANLRGASLRGAYVIGANLSGADLTEADLIGADLRDANVCGADLSQALFVTQQQINSAQGDRMTRLRVAIERPSHWA